MNFTRVDVTNKSSIPLYRTEYWPASIQPGHTTINPGEKNVSVATIEWNGPGDWWIALGRDRLEKAYQLHYSFKWLEGKKGQFGPYRANTDGSTPNPSSFTEPGVGTVHFDDNAVYYTFYGKTVQHKLRLFSPPQGGDDVWQQYTGGTDGQDGWVGLTTREGNPPSCSLNIDDLTSRVELTIVNACQRDISLTLKQEGGTQIYYARAAKGGSAPIEIPASLVTDAQWSFDLTGSYVNDGANDGPLPPLFKDLVPDPLFKITRMGGG